MPNRFRHLRRLALPAAALGGVLAACMMLACSHGTGSASGSSLISEASGILFDSDTLFIVSDDIAGSYFTLPSAAVASGIIPIDSARLTRVAIPGAELFSDLESIERLADGRIVLLSEDLHALGAVVQKAGSPALEIVAQFDQTLAELGNRGLEGVAVRPLPGGASLVAVSWEGGYPERQSLSAQLRETIGSSPLNPVVVIDTIPPNGSAGYVGTPARSLVLTTPDDGVPPPLGQRFRVADLVWHTWTDSAGTVDGLIVLLSSSNAPTPESGQKRRFQYKWLHRYDLNGKPVGNPLDVSAAASTQWRSFSAQELVTLAEPLRSRAEQFGRTAEAAGWENVNWEGLSWYLRGESLVLIYDAGADDPLFALVIAIPQEWK